MSDWSKAVSGFVPAAGGGLSVEKDEPLLFEQDGPGRSGVDLPPAPQIPDRLAGLRREGRIGLPGLSEPQVIRHYTRLSQRNYSIDTGIYPPSEVATMILAWVRERCRQASNV